MKTGVIVANTGSPSSTEPDDIESYLREFLLDDRICPMPKPVWKYVVYRHILPKRKHSSSKRYQFIWTPDGSPLIVNQRKVADKLQASFDSSFEKGSYLVRSAMSYGSPSMVDTLNELRESGCDRVVLLPLYPQSAYSPTLAVIDSFKRAKKKLGWDPASCIVDNYHDNPLYIKAIADSIRSAGFGGKEDDRLVLSFHAIPLKDEKNGDTYRAQIKESAALLAQDLGISADKITISFQSVFGHKEESWVSPLSIHVLPEWRDQEFRVFFGCPGFAIDCLETLFDIPNEICPALEGEQALPTVTCTETNGDIQAACNTNGRFNWIPSLNASDRHIEVLRDVLDRAIASSSFAD